MTDKQMNILVVDDYNTMRRIVRNLLKQLGFENVEEAEDGAAALAKLKSKRFHLILSDWNMQPMNGLDLLKKLRGSLEFKDIPFILITAESKPEQLMAARQAGVSNYIIKPFNADILKAKMASVIGAF